jgi:hypothetical protein
MKHAARAAAAGLAQDAERVVIGFTGVDDQRQPAPDRELDLPGEHCVLSGRGREVVVVVETDLAERAGHRLGVDGGLDGQRRTARIIGELPRRMRMDADGESNLRPVPAHFPRLVQLRFVVRREDHQSGRDARLARPLNDVGEIGSELGTRDVAVAVDHRQAPLRRLEVTPGRAPSGTLDALTASDA